MMDCGTPPSSIDETTRRETRKRNNPNPSELICPVCGVTIRTQEIDMHFAVELERLERSTGCSKQRKDKSDEASTSGASFIPPSPGTSSSKKDHAQTSESTWGTYQKIKTNRQARLKTKSRKRKSIENICPVCNRRTSEEIHVHVEKCLNRLEKRQRARLNNGASDEEEMETGTAEDDDEDEEDSIDIVGEPFEEYEWAGQTRIRATALIPGGLSSTGIGSNSIATAASAENEEDLNVDGDDTHIYGPSQFTEKDVIPARSQAADNYLRSLIAGESPSKSGAQMASGERVNDREEVDPPECEDSDSSTTSDRQLSSPVSIQDQIIESLKARIKEYEKESSQNKKCHICMICMDDYKSPTVSICCWHVHCETCWLKALGSRKLCPKCNMITSAADLRRIYL